MRPGFYVGYKFWAKANIITACIYPGVKTPGNYCENSRSNQLMGLSFAQLSIAMAFNCHGLKAAFIPGLKPRAIIVKIPDQIN